MQDANEYLDHVLSEAGARVSTDSAPDVINDIKKGQDAHLAVSARLQWLQLEPPANALMSMPHVLVCCSCQFFMPHML